MISFVCYLWHEPESDRVFSPEHVNVLRRMVKRNYRHPHRFICVTDETAGFNKKIELVRPRYRFAEIENTYGPRLPSCYRRLWNFSEEARDVLGERIVSIDIDCIITGDLAPLLHREGDFIGWSDSRFSWEKVAGGIYLLETGTHTDVWDDFDPLESPNIAKEAGCGGSDQAWMTYKLSPLKHKWTEEDGLAKIGWQPPKHSRILFTSGHNPPWAPHMQVRYPWIREYWH